MKENENIDDLFREKLQNYEQKPPAYILEKILVGAAGKPNQKKLFFWRVAAVAAALLLAFVAGWQLNDREGAGLKQPVLASQDKGNITIQRTEISSINAAETFQQKKNTFNHEISEPTNSGRKASDSETRQLASTNESILIKPIKNLNHLIQTGTETETKLHTRKTNEVAVKSIDQQIMEQNQQMLMAQNSVKEKGHWLLGAQVSPVHNGSKNSQSAQYASNMLSTESSNTIDLGGGITVEYKPGKRWSIQSGVYYGGIEQASDNSVYATGSKNSISADFGSEYLTTKVNVDAKNNRASINSAAGVIQLYTLPENLVIGNSIESKDMSSALFVSDAQFTQNFEYLEIPLYLRYTLLDTKFDIEILGGFSSNVLVGNQAFVETNSGKTLVGKTNDMELINYSGTMGMGFKYGLSKRFFLNVEPRVKYYLNSLNSNESVSYKPYTIGVFTGLSYQF